LTYYKGEVLKKYELRTPAEIEKKCNGKKKRLKLPMKLIGG